MEELPARNSGWWSLGSILLGILAFLSSFLFIWLMLNGLLALFGDPFFTRHKYLFWLYTGGGMFLYIPVNLVLGLLGAILGLTSLDSNPDRNRSAKTGIVLNVLAILGGIPAMLAFFAFLRAS